MVEQRKIYFSDLEPSSLNKQSNLREGRKSINIQFASRELMHSTQCTQGVERFSKVRKSDHIFFVGDFVMRIGASKFQ